MALRNVDWEYRSGRIIKNNKKSHEIGNYYMYLPIFLYLCVKHQYICKMTKDINRIKVVLVEKKRTGKWLAEQIGKDPATVSKWCTNTSQPDLRTLIEISNCLQVDIKDLLNTSKE
jgi:DNA-binding Xre family transcriptional regulator